MRSLFKIPFLPFVLFFPAIIIATYLLFFQSGSDPTETFQPIEEEVRENEWVDERSKFEFREEEDLDSPKRENFLSNSLLLTQLSGFPFLFKTKEIFDTLGENIFRPDHHSATQSKSFHEKLEYLENKKSFTGLDPLEEEEFILVQLRKKKDLREILNKTFEKFKEELSATQRKEFLTELQSLDRSILELSQKSK
ncbi:hypothetical protein [Leptospira sarikeiensis]|uniref:Uncharacterized protein n=1 Tax=Leptospira sarikeiensis TaxID=2484943 RepID=A0A4V3JRM0_9LEPT|nr:hypothetical protein [Leptospira sarikeiensis]TGL60562.1 hypothetical protein EHQ64_12075 [Leptospira sarikeiensis]